MGCYECYGNRIYFSKDMNLGALAGRSTLKEATLGVLTEEDGR